MNETTSVSFNSAAVADGKPRNLVAALGKLGADKALLVDDPGNVSLVRSARNLPKASEDLWDALTEFDCASREALFAHCVSMSVNAVRGVVPIIAIDGRPVGDGAPGPRAEALGAVFGAR